jgi:hypothetical protein
VRKKRNKIDSTITFTNIRNNGKAPVFYKDSSISVQHTRWVHTQKKRDHGFNQCQ